MERDCDWRWTDDYREMKIATNWKEILKGLCLTKKGKRKIFGDMAIFWRRMEEDKMKKTTDRTSWTDPYEGRQVQ